MKSITVQELKTALDSSTPPQLLDVRRKATFQTADELVTGALWRNPEQVPEWSVNLDRGRLVVVYCVHGHEVSQGCASRLAELGCAAAYLEGGIEAWKEAGGSMSVKTSA